MCKLGRPEKFTNPKQIAKKFDEYLEFCRINDRFANIAGLCRFLEIVRDTWYEYCKKPLFSDTCKMIQEILEDETLNTKVLTPAEKIFYQKNKFGYRDNKLLDDIAEDTEITIIRKSKNG